MTAPALRFRLILLIAQFLAASVFARGGGIKCACTTADCIATGIDLCRTESFCYSKLKRLQQQQEDTAVPLEKGCLTRANRGLCSVGAAAAGSAEEFVVHLGGQLYVHCCSTCWCNSVLQATLPALTATTAAAAAEPEDQHPKRPWRLRPAELPAKKSPHSVEQSPPQPPPQPNNHRLRPQSAVSLRTPPQLQAVEPTVAWRQRRPGRPPPRPPPPQTPEEASVGGLDSVSGIGVGVGVGSAGHADLIHPVFIAVPVTSLCLILSALAALIVLVRRRDQLHYQPGEPMPQRQHRHLHRQHRNQHQHQHQHQQQQHQYHLYYRNSMLDCEAAAAVAAATASSAAAAVRCPASTELIDAGESPTDKKCWQQQQQPAHQLLLADYPDVTLHTGGAISGSPTL